VINAIRKDEYFSCDVYRERTGWMKVFGKCRQRSNRIFSQNSWEGANEFMVALVDVVKPHS